MNSNTVTNLTPAAAGGANNALVEYIRTQRQTAAYVMLGLSIGLLILTIVFAIRGFKTEPAKVDENAPAEVDPLNPDAPPTPKSIADPKQGDYRIAALASALAFLATGAVGVWLQIWPQRLTPEAQRTDARIAILSSGGLVGSILVSAGALYFYKWSASLIAWLDKGEIKERQWAAYPLLMIVGGALVLFLSVLPARAEERTNSLMRRLVYGANLALSILLLFVALVVVNVVVGIRVPNRLDTTESGFYSLSDTTKEFLTNLDQPVTAYAILQDGGRRSTDDIRRLLQTAADVPGTRLKVKFISPVADKTELRTLAGKYPQVELNETGVLLTVGEDEKRHTFLREDEFTESVPSGARREQVFVGESRLLRELAFLAENKQKAVVYFTQSSGELDIGGGGMGREDTASPAASGARIKAFLEKNYLDVRPLTFDPKDAKVPDDAAVVVVAEPRGPLSDAAVAAIRKYMSTPRAENKKGKLFVLSGARFGADRKVIRTGLEPLLSEYKIQLSERFIMGDQTRELHYSQCAVMFTPNAVRARNPVALSLGEKFVILAPEWRPVSAMPQAQADPHAQAAIRAIPLLMTAPPGRSTWLEEENPSGRVNEIFAQLNGSAAVRREKQVTDSPRPVGAVATEGDVGRVAVIGNGAMVSDAAADPSSGAPITFDLVGVTIDWLRDRPAVGAGIESKKYVTYTFPAVSDETRVLWMPLGLAMLTVVGFGTGVWMIRRK